VTACHALLAMSLVGVPQARLYPGSWSEWSSDPERPIATGT
jgi:thiosulfate/3-mercaptopyruvate sulfurtransferase